MKTTRLLALSFALAASALAQHPDTLKHSIPAPPVGVQSGAQLGSSVAVAGEFTVAGATRDDIGGQDAGAVKVFNTATGALLHVIPNPDPQINGYFGEAVAISGSRVVVGLPQNYRGGANIPGRAYVYDLAGSTPTVPVMTLSDPSPGAADNFGRSVAISGTRVVVGARGNSTGAYQAGCAHLYDLASSTPTTPVATLYNPTPEENDNFGASVAISGARVVVGAYFDNTGAHQAGSAYVYDLASATPTVPVTTLNNPTPATGEYFGYSVAISGARVAVGAKGGGDGGGAFVYDVTSATPTVPVATLSNPDPDEGDVFGTSIAIDGTRVVVGAENDDLGGAFSGSAYVFDVASATPSQPVATLNNPTPAVGDEFGYAVGISGTRVVAGAPTDDTGASNAGSAYIYDIASAQPTVPTATLNNPGPRPWDEFGNAVAVSGTLMVIGAYGEDGGQAYVYDLSSATPTMPMLTLNNPDPTSSNSFGVSVAISGTRMVVGGASSGPGYVYDLTSATPTVPVFTLNNPCRSVAISGTRVVMGSSDNAHVYDLSSATPTVPVAKLNSPAYSVAISGTRVVTGAYGGSVNVYDMASATPTVPVATLNNPGPGPGYNFGSAVAIAGTRVVVGDSSDSPQPGGSAYVYDLTSATPTTPVTTLNNPEPEQNDGFGRSVSISGTRVLIGANEDHTGTGNGGSAYVYDLASGTPTVPVAALRNPTPALQTPVYGSGDEFGYAVAIDGTTAVIGAHRDDAVMFNKGFAYVFVPAPAAAVPIVSPLGGTYEESVTVSIATTSEGATIRYTTDGSTPSASNGVTYTAPFTLTTSATMRAIALGGGWSPSPVATVGYTVLTPLPFWRNLHGLPADGSHDLLNPSGDGVVNLLKFAFNMAANAGDLAKSNVNILPENGTAGLPFIDRDAQGRLVIEFVRRKASRNPGIAYIVETCDDLASWNALSLTSATVESIDATWERVTVVDPVVSSKRFGRVRLQSGVYFNDFNANLGAATLRGTAVLTNGAVKLTDENAGGFGAVIFEGVPAGPQLTGFTARFHLALGPISFGVPADGASFAVGDLGGGPWGETGPGTAHSFAVGFDTYNNGSGDAENTGIHLWVNGVHLAYVATNPYTNGVSVPVEISYVSGGLTVKFNGATIFNNVAISGFSFQASDKFGIGARTGGFAERATIDNVEIAPR